MVPGPILITVAISGLRRTQIMVTVCKIPWFRQSPRRKRTPKKRVFGVRLPQLRLLPLGGQGCRGMGRPSSVGLTFYFYLVICIMAVTGVTRKVNHDRFRPAASTFVTP